MMIGAKLTPTVDISGKTGFHSFPSFPVISSPISCPFMCTLARPVSRFHWTAGSATASSGESRGDRFSELDCQHQHVPWIAELLGWLGVTLW